MRNEPWVWPEVGDAGTSGAGAMPLRSAQLMGQKKEEEKKRRHMIYKRSWKEWCSTGVECISTDEINLYFSLTVHKNASWTQSSAQTFKTKLAC